MSRDAKIAFNRPAQAPASDFDPRGRARPVDNQATELRWFGPQTDRKARILAGHQLQLDGAGEELLPPPGQLPRRPQDANQ